MRKKILLGVSGGIACYKSLELCRMFAELGIGVKVVMTQSAQKFVTPLSFQTLTQNSVGTDLFDPEEEREIGHIRMAQSHDLILVAPATANIIAKSACGIGDDLLSTILLATNCPVIFVPAMNDRMWINLSVQENLKTLKSRGVQIISPAKGLLACGSYGPGRLADLKDIVSTVLKQLKLSEKLKGKKILVTGGGTKEWIDAFRYLSNPSSGKMGKALAEEAANRGAKVTYVHSFGELPEHSQIQKIAVNSAQEMADAVFQIASEADCIIQAAAVSDYRPEKIFPGKIKKQDRFECSFVQTVDILAELGRRKKGYVLVGFAAESENLEKNMKEKFTKKNLDLIVGNLIGKENCGFGTETNEGILWDGREKKQIPNMKKSEFACEILDEVEKILGN